MALPLQDPGAMPGKPEQSRGPLCPEHGGSAILNTIEEFVKPLFIVGATVLTIAMAGCVQVRNSLPATDTPQYPFCLEENSGGDGGSMPLLCRFESQQQCDRSRMSPADRCVPNTTGQRS